MPNRIIKESICRSEEIDSLSWFEEVLFYRLIVTCDDFGRYDGRAKIIKGSCFPLKDITEKDIDKALGRLSAVGLVRVYEAQGRPYLQLVTWADHQRIRNQKSKYPGFSEDCELLTFDSKVGYGPVCYKRVFGTSMRIRDGDKKTGTASDDFPYYEIPGQMSIEDFIKADEK